MAELSIGSAIGEGFGLIRRRPVSVLIWGVVQACVTGSFLALLAPVYQMMFAQIAAAAQSGGHPPPPNLAMMSQMQGMSFLLNFVSYFVRAVLYCAVFRAVLHPEQGRFAYLRLGMTEFLLFVFMIAAYIGLFVAMVIFAIPVGIVIAILAAAHIPAAAVLVGIAAVLFAAVALTYVALRFCLIGPMMVEDGKLHFSDAWAITKGKVGALFLVGLSLGVMLVVGEMVVGLIFVVSGISALGGMGQLAAQLRGSPEILLSNLSLVLSIAIVALVPLSGVIIAILGAPWARAYRDLAGPDLAATFS